MKSLTTSGRASKGLQRSEGLRAESVARKEIDEEIEVVCVGGRVENNGDAEWKLVQCRTHTHTHYVMLSTPTNLCSSYMPANTREY